jgi:hypothetical protein
MVNLRAGVWHADLAAYLRNTVTLSFVIRRSHLLPQGREHFQSIPVQSRNDEHENRFGQYPGGLALQRAVGRHGRRRAGAVLWPMPQERL